MYASLSEATLFFGDPFEAFSIEQLIRAAVPNLGYVRNLKGYARYCSLIKLLLHLVTFSVINHLNENIFFEC